MPKYKQCKKRDGFQAVLAASEKQQRDGFLAMLAAKEKQRREIAKWNDEWEVAKWDDRRKQMKNTKKEI